MDELIKLFNTTQSKNIIILALNTIIVVVGAFYSNKARKRNNPPNDTQYSSTGFQNGHIKNENHTTDKPNFWAFGIELSKKDKLYKLTLNRIVLVVVFILLFLFAIALCIKY